MPIFLGAQNIICQKASQNAQWKDLIDQNQVCKDRIILPFTSKKILVQISMKANKIEDDSKFKSYWCEIVSHAREQYVLFGKHKHIKKSGKKNSKAFMLSIIVA